MASQKGTLAKYWWHCIIVGNVQSRLYATIGRASSNDLILSWKLVYCPTVAYRLVAIAEPCTIVATATTARMLFMLTIVCTRGTKREEEPSVPIDCDGSRGLDMNKRAHPFVRCYDSPMYSRCVRSVTFIRDLTWGILRAVALIIHMKVFLSSLQIWRPPTKIKIINPVILITTFSHIIIISIKIRSTAMLNSTKIREVTSHLLQSSSHNPYFPILILIYLSVLKIAWFKLLMHVF